MKKKQSSIDWLVDQLDNFLELYPSEWEKIIEIKKKAKAMHREEIESAWEIGSYNGYDKACDNITWDVMDNNKDNYYNETFGGNNE